MTSLDTVDVITGARLHFGLICGTPATGWNFGGFGLMVRDPGWHLRIRQQPSEVPLATAAGALSADVVTVCSTDGVPSSVSADRVSAAVARAQEVLGISSGSLTVEVLRSMPLHSGFGSGTQLALAMVSGMQVLRRYDRSFDMQQLAEQLGRAGRSAIGTEGFSKGGLIVDYGRTSTSGEPRRLLRVSLPDDWRFVLVRPESVSGLSGESERQYFERRCTMSVDLIRSVGDMIEGPLLTAVREQSFALFAETLSAYGQQIGRFYASAQGDVFSSPQMGDLANWLESQGVHGTAQSSWGPGVCIPAASENDAETIAEMIARRLARQDSGRSGESVQITVTSALNHGASIRSAAPHDNERRWL